MNSSSFLCALVSFCATAAVAGLPEPDAVFYGTVAISNRLVTAARTDVTVEVRQSPNGPAVSAYRMGTSPGAGNRYVVRARVESAAPVDDPAATPVGATVYLVLKEGTAVRDQRTHTITSRGQFVSLDFGAPDSDGDGLSDAFEQLYFGSATGGNPDADPDGDGLSNRNEYLLGSDPLVADSKHPADNAPADGVLTADEAAAYASAWKSGESWPIDPARIPVQFVARASALAAGGAYVLTNAPGLTSPLWWINAPPPAPVTNGPDARTLTRAVPSNYALYVPFTVYLNVTPGPGTRAVAIEETPPPGWIVRFITDGGRYSLADKKLRWGPFTDGLPKTLAYELTPLTTNAAAVFTGLGSFDGTNVTVLGTSNSFPAGTSAPPSLLNPNFNPVTLVMSFDLQGDPNRTYQIEMSDDLVQWVLAGQSPTLGPSGQQRLNITLPPGNKRFFRARRLD